MSRSPLFEYCKSGLRHGQQGMNRMRLAGKCRGGAFLTFDEKIFVAGVAFLLMRDAMIPPGGSADKGPDGVGPFASPVAGSGQIAFFRK